MFTAALFTTAGGGGNPSVRQHTTGHLIFQMWALKPREVAHDFTAGVAEQEFKPTESVLLNIM